MSSFRLDSSASTHWLSTLWGWAAFTGSCTAFVTINHVSSEFPYFLASIVAACAGCAIGALRLVVQRLDKHSGLTSRLAVWSAEFLLNLVVPSLLGLLLLSHRGQIGASVAIAVVYCCGCNLCIYSVTHSQAMNRGAEIVGVSQFFPILQLMVGYVAFNVVSQLGMTGSQLTVMTFQLHQNLVGLSQRCSLAAPCSSLLASWDI
jgi:hypothetical protein